MVVGDGHARRFEAVQHGFVEGEQSLVGAQPVTVVEAQACDDGGELVVAVGVGEVAGGDL
ncbi:hypothetical protein O7630_18165 [Micromonospora sp. WMMD718]|uniref:hypothetical protein n=1 Tax=Micromonospora sp. WMMD718 TaxID=3016098 RepID=UPI001EF008E9|nr:MULTISPECIES: hypothetical protein [Micromonospora]MDG4752868.1 hypothetical protein [Micromonospora sp. WMMD718]